MRKVRSSGKTSATASLISQLDCRSLPSGFSSPIRTFAPASPADSSPLIVGRNSVGAVDRKIASPPEVRSEEHTSELQSLMRISYAVFCLKKKKQYTINRLNQRR